MKRITLNSRYGEHNALEEVYENKYILNTRNNYRVGTTSEGNLFLDPSGGPFMTKGTVLDGGQVVKEVIEENNKHYVILES